MSQPKHLTAADLVVLAVLLGHQPMHGYELVRKLEQADVEDWAPISIPQVYYSLRKMARSGHIIPVPDMEPALGPHRTVYRPADDALKAMQSALGEVTWINQRPPTPFITWTALAVHAAPETISTQFDRRADFLKNEITREEETLTSLKGVEGPGTRIARVMISLAIRQFTAELETLDDLRAAILTEIEIAKTNY